MTSTASPAFRRILNAAVTQFARHGYDGASLADIAATAGIRKASLYSHVKNKDALFLAVFEDALQAETCFAHERFVAPGTNLPGMCYCQSLSERYAKSDYFRFLLRTSYIPPESLFNELQEGYEAYMQQLLADFTKALRRHIGTPLSEQDTEIMGQAYMALVDSLQVALIYIGQERFESRLKAVEQLMHDSIARLTVGATND